MLIKYWPFEVKVSEDILNIVANYAYLKQGNKTRITFTGNILFNFAENEYITSKETKRNLKTERRWIFLLFGIIGLWLLVLGSTLFTTVTKSGLLIDTEVDLSYVTMPLLGIILVYTIITIFIFVVYLVSFDRVKRYQISIKSSTGRNGNDIAQSASNKIYPSRLM